MECDLCSVIGYEIPILKNDNAVVIFAKDSVTYNNTLILPRKHVKVFHLLDPRESKDLSRLVLDFAEGLRDNCDNFKITLDFEDNPQYHAHYQVQPKYPGVRPIINGHLETMDRELISELQLAKLIEKLRQSE